MTRFIISPRARADVEAIWNYTAEHWGLAQAETYIRQIQAAVEILASNPTRGRPCDDIRAGYRKYPAGSHILFYRLKADGIDVARILHGRMDFDRHL